MGVRVNGFLFFLIDIFGMTAFTLNQNELDALRELKRLVEVLTL